MLVFYADGCVKASFTELGGGLSTHIDTHFVGSLQGCLELDYLSKFSYFTKNLLVQIRLFH